MSDGHNLGTDWDKMNSEFQDDENCHAIVRSEKILKAQITDEAWNTKMLVKPLSHMLNWIEQLFFTFKS